MFASWGNAKNKEIPPVSFAHCFPEYKFDTNNKNKEKKTYHCNDM